MNGVTIYGASSPHIPDHYLKAAHRVGELLAINGVTLICGGGHTGVMGAAIDGTLLHQGQAIGVLPQFMVERGWQHPALTHMEVTPDMHTRKALMARLATRGIIAMPGGVGTLEELMEIITWHKLGLYTGNIVILNINGYYDPLLTMLTRTIQQGFMKPDNRIVWHTAPTADDAVRHVLARHD